MRKSRIVTTAAGVLLSLSCSDSTSPEACKADTSSVTATISNDQNPVFDWSPACGVAMVLIEEDASDRWLVMTNEDTWDSPDQANRIFPPVRYGQIPSGSTQVEPPNALVAGRTYELILWRVLPQGSTATCLQKFENVCLMLVQEFKR